ncbi:MAG TPA: YtcA family lipoprotein [Candidatus Binataceae bacterium]|nr:YtcA family lipoprotein [Candidatus Binataceae bacterium]
MTQYARFSPSVASLKKVAVAGYGVAIAGLLTALAVGAGGCDPVINIGGANFPGWLLCSIVGVAMAGLMRPLFVALGIERYLGPGVLIYPCLVILLGCLTWLLFFNRV